MRGCGVARQKPGHLTDWYEDGFHLGEQDHHPLGADHHRHLGMEEVVCQVRNAEYNSELGIFNPIDSHYCTLDELYVSIISVCLDILA